MKVTISFSNPNKTVSVYIDDNIWEFFSPRPANQDDYIKLVIKGLILQKEYTFDSEQCYLARLIKNDDDSVTAIIADPKEINYPSVSLVNQSIAGVSVAVSAETDTCDPTKWEKDGSLSLTEATQCKRQELFRQGKINVILPKIDLSKLKDQDVVATKLELEKIKTQYPIVAQSLNSIETSNNNAQQRITKLTELAAQIKGTGAKTNDFPEAKSHLEKMIEEITDAQQANVQIKVQLEKLKDDYVSDITQQADAMQNATMVINRVKAYIGAALYNIISNYIEKLPSENRKKVLDKIREVFGKLLPINNDGTIGTFDQLMQHLSDADFDSVIAVYNNALKLSEHDEFLKTEIHYFQAQINEAGLLLNSILAPSYIQSFIPTLLTPKILTKNAFAWEKGHIVWNTELRDMLERLKSTEHECTQAVTQRSTQLTDSLQFDSALEDTVTTVTQKVAEQTRLLEIKREAQIIADEIEQIKAKIAEDNVLVQDSGAIAKLKQELALLPAHDEIDRVYCITSKTYALPTLKPYIDTVELAGEYIQNNNQLSEEVSLEGIEGSLEILKLQKTNITTARQEAEKIKKELVIDMALIEKQKKLLSIIKTKIESITTPLVQSGDSLTKKIKKQKDLLAENGLTTTESLHDIETKFNQLKLPDYQTFITKAEKFVLAKDQSKRKSLADELINELNQLCEKLETYKTDLQDLTTKMQATEKEITTKIEASLATQAAQRIRERDNAETALIAASTTQRYSKIFKNIPHSSSTPQSNFDVKVTNYSAPKSFWQRHGGKIVTSMWIWGTAFAAVGGAFGSIPLAALGTAAGLLFGFTVGCVVGAIADCCCTPASKQTSTTIISNNQPIISAPQPSLKRAKSLIDLRQSVEMTRLDSAPPARKTSPQAPQQKSKKLRAATLNLSKLSHFATPAILQPEADTLQVGLRQRKRGNQSGS